MGAQRGLSVCGKSLCASTLTLAPNFPHEYCYVLRTTWCALLRSTLLLTSSPSSPKQPHACRRQLQPIRLRVPFPSRQCTHYLDVLIPHVGYSSRSSTSDDNWSIKLQGYLGIYAAHSSLTNFQEPQHEEEAKVFQRWTKFVNN